MKRPRIITSEKKIFLVVIESWYWEFVHGDHWYDMTEMQKDEKRNELYDQIEKELTSNKKTLIIFSPMLHESAITVQQVAGKKNSRIVYKHN